MREELKMNRCKLSLRYCGIAVLLLHTYSLYGTTLVYNLKLRRAFDVSSFLSTRQEKVAATTLQKVVVTALPVFYWQKRNIVIPSLGQDIHEKTLLLGSLFNIRARTSNYWWVELTTGLENQSVTSTGTNTFNISRVGMDDTIVSVGKDFFIGNRAQIVVYGLAGAPFEQNVTSLETQTALVGSRFYGLGAGMEVSYAFIKKPERICIGFLQTRFVHSLTRSWYPVLSLGDRIQPGNTTDLFAVIRYREKKNAFEIGYNPTFFTNQAALLQTGKVNAPNYVRNSLYSAYEYLFEKSFLLKAPGTVGIGLNAGKINLFDTKIVSGWFSLTLLF